MKFSIGQELQLFLTIRKSRFGKFYWIFNIVPKDLGIIIFNIFCNMEQTNNE